MSGLLNLGGTEKKEYKDARQFDLGGGVFAEGAYTDSSQNSSSGLQDSNENIVGTNSDIRVTYVDSASVAAAENIATDALENNRHILGRSLDFADGLVGDVVDEFGAITRDSFLTAENLTGEALDFGRDSYRFSEGVVTDAFDYSSDTYRDALGFGRDSLDYSQRNFEGALNFGESQTNKLSAGFDSALNTIGGIVYDAMKQSRDIVSTASGAFNRAADSVASSSKTESEKAIKYGVWMVGIVAAALVLPRMFGGK